MTTYTGNTDYPSGGLGEFLQFLAVNPQPAYLTMKTRICKSPPTAKLYTVEDLQLATRNFSQEKLLREGSLGSVFEANLPDGQILAVHSINTVSLSLYEGGDFLDVVRLASDFKHPNIVSLVGYSVEREQRQAPALHLVYEYTSNLTLDRALHSLDLALDWDSRFQIAIGVARALEYMHSLPTPIGHGNLKACNVLLDDKFMPRLCDCGLSVLRPLSRKGDKASKRDIASDIYAFGVLLLELLTGRRASDSEEEQSLVEWALPGLYDSFLLESMVDPKLRRISSVYPTQMAISFYATVIMYCLEPVQPFNMSDFLEGLTNISSIPVEEQNPSNL